MKIFSKFKIKLNRKKRGILLFIVFIIVTILFALKDLPSPTKLSSALIPQSSQIFDRNDKLLFTIYTEKNQTFIPISTIPKYLQEATISIEDKDFYRHGAIDIRGIIRASISTIFYNQIQGGSTITQQLVKNSLLSQEQTITRKIKEIILAFATEIIYSKSKILEMYLNQSPYGGTAYGVEAASEIYFGKHAKDLDLAESAILAGLPESPTVYSPFGAHPELAKNRQIEILTAMEKQKYITIQEKDKAIRKPLIYQSLSNTIQAPHFSLYVKELLVKKYGQDAVEQGGLRIKTSLDLNIQQMAQNIVASEVAKLKQYDATNGSAMVTNPATGEILAMVGSKDYFDKENDGNVNVTLALRQPGSSIKPINYAVGLLRGYTAATPFIDKPICFPNPGEKPYCPLNYDGKWNGAIQMRYALANSINIPAVKLLKLTGIDAMIATASAMGIHTFTDPNRYGLSLTLGGGEVTMIDMVTAYGVFANQGYRIDLHPILKVTNSRGKIIEEYSPPPIAIFGKKVLPSSVAFIISQMLSDNDARSYAFGSNSELRIGKLIIPVKTGTTNDYRDNWTIGYTPSFVVAAWVGNNDNHAMNGLVSGVTGAAPIWHKIMAELVKEKGVSIASKPDTVIGKIICATSGLLPPAEGAPDRCPTRYEFFIRGTEPQKYDTGKQKVFIDKGTHDLAISGQTDNIEEKDEFIVTDPTGERYCISCPHQEQNKK